LGTEPLNAKPSPRRRRRIQVSRGFRNRSLRESAESHFNSPLEEKKVNRLQQKGGRGEASGIVRSELWGKLVKGPSTRMSGVKHNSEKRVGGGGSLYKGDHLPKEESRCRGIGIGGEGGGKRSYTK